MMNDILWLLKRRSRDYKKFMRIVMRMRVRGYSKDVIMINLWWAISNQGTNKVYLDETL